MSDEVGLESVRTERVDDIPLLISVQQRMGVREVLDEVIEPHGNWDGATVGTVATVWLSYMLSEGNHFMCHVENWAQERRESLARALGDRLGEKDLTDDRLSGVLRYLDVDTDWHAIEQQLGKRLIRVYDLDSDTARLDSTTMSVHHDPGGEHGLLQFGHSKDHRPDLKQLKLMLGVLDPLGLPLATLVVPGNEADDGLYVPTVEQSRPILGSGMLYVGDVKMAALRTRAHLDAQGDYYLTALPRTGKNPELLEELLEPVFSGQQVLEEVRDGPEDGLRARGYETVRAQSRELDGQTVEWQERVLVVQSVRQANKQERALETRLENAIEQLEALTPPRGRGRRQYEQRDRLEAAVEKVISGQRVTGLLNVALEREVERREVRQYGDRPARTEERVRWVVSVERNHEAIEAAKRRFGWRLQVTNASRERLPFAQAIASYRASHTVERGLRRFKHRKLGINPLYLRREDHITGLARLLSLGLRVLTLTEHTVREKLAATGEALAGLYPGNPKRTTARPTTERMLEAFKGISLSVIELGGQTLYHVPPLTDLQRKILTLMDLTPDIYDRLAQQPTSISA